jgi:hypothetical protein
MGRVAIFLRAACLCISVHICAYLCMAALIGAPAMAAGGTGLPDPFDAAALSVKERRVVQSARAHRAKRAGASCKARGRCRGFIAGWLMAGGPKGLMRPWPAMQRNVSPPRP